MGKPPFHPGDKVKNYTIAQQFSVGRAGAVYNIANESILLKAPFADSNETLLEQFREEVRSLQTLKHPGIMGIIEADIVSDMPWYATQLPPQETLRNYIEKEAPLPFLKALRNIVWITEAVAHAHTQNPPIWHRELKPENICFKKKRLVVLDFGLAQFGTTANFREESNLLYMAPEQLDPRGRPDLRADVYALGVIFYELLTGDPPFGKIAEIGVENKRIEAMEKVLDFSLPAPKIKDIEKNIQEICAKALAKKAENRYGNAQEMLEEIQKVFKEYLLQEVEECEQQKNLDAAIHFLEEAYLYDISEESLEKLQNFQKKRSEKIRAKVLRENPDSFTFKNSLRQLLNIARECEQESSRIVQEELQKIFLDALELTENVQSWQQVISDLEKVQSYIYTCMPFDKSQMTIGVEQKPEVKVVSQEQYAADFEISPDEDDLPTSVMGKVDIPTDIKIDKIPQQEAEVPLQTADFEVILEKSQPVKVQKDKKLPQGFRWVDKTNIVCEKDDSEMIYIPAGTFYMGSNQERAFNAEKPEHKVYLYDYFVDKYLVTWRQYLLFCQETGYQKPPPPRWGIKGDHPVVNVNWYDAQAYCKWAGKVLLTEAQWEKAGKGGIWLDGDNSKKIKNPHSRRKYPWGKEIPGEGEIWRANYNDEPNYGRNKGQKSTSKVGEFAIGASPYGCMDMAGNTWEWCLDWYDESYYSKSPQENPMGPSEEEVTTGNDEKPGRILRGGSWYTNSRLLRVSARRSRSPDGKGGSCGMRAGGLFITTKGEKK